MKLEREPVFGHISLGHKPDSKSFDYNDLSLESNGLKSGNIAKETQNRPLCDFKDEEKDSTQLVYLMNDRGGLAASKVDCFKKVDDLKTHKEYGVKDFVAPFTKSSLETDSMEKTSDYYMDKSVMECELPELEVCYKESGYSCVKDICVDEGVPSQDMILFESGTEKKGLCTVVFPDNDKQLNKESEEEFANVCESKDSMLGGEVKEGATHKTENDVSQDKIFPKNVILMKELHADNADLRPSSWDCNASAQIQRSIGEAAEKLNHRSEEALVISAPVSGAEESNSSSSHANELSYDSKVVKGSFTFGFLSLASVTVANEECPQNGISECLETENTSPVTTTSEGRHERPQNGVPGCDVTPNVAILEDGTFETQIVSTKTQHELAREESSQKGACGCDESPNTSSVDQGTSESHNDFSHVEHVMSREESPRSSVSGCHESQTISGQIQYGGQGESSFSAVGPLSGRINYSGPVPYSGSVSLRSDSSTTSTRSFAFPILQPEWNSSPVRMAKADRRHFRKHRGWRQGLLCCKF